MWLNIRPLVEIGLDILCDLYYLKQKNTAPKSYYREIPTRSLMLLMKINSDKFCKRTVALELLSC